MRFDGETCLDDVEGEFTAWKIQAEAVRHFVSNVGVLVVEKLLDEREIGLGDLGRDGHGDLAHFGQARSSKTVPNRSK